MISGASSARATPATAIACARSAGATETVSGFGSLIMESRSMVLRPARCDTITCAGAVRWFWRVRPLRRVTRQPMQERSGRRASPRQRGRHLPALFPGRRGRSGLQEVAVVVAFVRLVAGEREHPVGRGREQQGAHGVPVASE
jgi:hypothetical protein